MHGRLKVKTTAEQEAEKRQKQELKKTAYVKGLNYIFALRSSGTADDEALRTTAEILSVNPDAVTLWNYRREILIKLIHEQPDQTLSLLGTELKVTETCLSKNPKSYAVWHHRGWVLKMHPQPPWEEELTLTARFLKVDARNFLCWDHRRFVSISSGTRPEDELDFSRRLIDDNLSNYSAWHYRSKLLPLVHLNVGIDSPHPIPEEILHRELKRVVEAVFTDPSDQSPWFFLRWLLTENNPTPRLVHAGLSRPTPELCLVVVVFSQAVNAKFVTSIELVLNGCQTQLVWLSDSNELFSYVWSAELVSINSSLELALSVTNLFDVKLRISDVDKRCVMIADQVGINLSPVTHLYLEEVLQNCLMLDDLEPGNKWVQVMLIDVMWNLDVKLHGDEIRDRLSQLEMTDSLRSRYYQHRKSQLNCEIALKNFSPTSPVFNGDNKGICYLFSCHTLALVTHVSLKGNSICDTKSLRSLVCCQILILDDNFIDDLNGLQHLKWLISLSLRNNRVKNFESLIFLKHLNLMNFDLGGNEICFVKDIASSVQELWPKLETITLV